MNELDVQRLNEVFSELKDLIFRRETLIAFIVIIFCIYLRTIQIQTNAFGNGQ